MHDPEHVPERRGGYLPPEDNGILGGGWSSALSGADALDWWCVAKLDSKPQFDRLLDVGEGGRFVDVPTEPFTVVWRHREDSDMLEAAFARARGRAVLDGSLNNDPAGRLPRAELARRVDGVEGKVAGRVEMRSTRRVQPRIGR